MSVHQQQPTCGISHPPSQIESYIGQYGWEFEKSDRDCWQTGWQGERTNYPLTIQHTDTWISFAVSPLMTLGLDWDAWPELLKHILEINNDCRMAKLCIDDFGEVSLRFEIINRDLSFTSFAESLSIVGYTTDQVYESLQLILDEVGFYYHGHSSMLSS